MQKANSEMQREIKSLVKEIVGEFPRTFNYATRVVERLSEKGVTVTKAQVYNVGSGISYNQEVAEEIGLLGSEYLTEQVRIRDAMRSVSEGMKEMATA